MDVGEVAKLSRLELDDKELASLGEDMNSIIEHINTISEAKTHRLEPLDLEADLREDEPLSSDDRDRLLGLAPVSEDGYFVAPKNKEAG
jgi:aspartyl-tRNA(Asn)/glutamyl-tRNA(Gln) amidotransferase subunit C